MRFRLWQADTYAVSSRFAACCRYGFINDYAWLAGLSTITGGAGADELTGGAGADDFVYTTFAQGGNVVDARVGGASITSGDTITDFTSGSDQIDISAVVTGTTATTGNGTGQSFDTTVFDDAVGLILSNFTVNLATTGEDVINALGVAFNNGITIGADDTAVFAIQEDVAGQDRYNIFAVENTTDLALADAGLINAGVNVYRFVFPGHGFAT